MAHAGLWDFLQDPTFWSWARAALPALLGAVAGGLFTLLGQRVSAHDERERNEKAWSEQRSAQADADVRADVRRLLEELMSLHRDIEARSFSFSELVNGISWRPIWAEIWSEDRSLQLDVLTELVRDVQARETLSAIVELLDGARNLTDRMWPRSIREDLRSLVRKLTDYGIKVVARNLRSEPFESSGDLEPLRARLREYAEWEDDQLKRAEETAEIQEREAREQRVVTSLSNLSATLSETAEGPVETTSE